MSEEEIKALTKGQICKDPNHKGFKVVKIVTESWDQVDSEITENETYYTIQVKCLVCKLILTSEDWRE